MFGRRLGLNEIARVEPPRGDRCPYKKERHEVSSHILHLHLHLQLRHGPDPAGTLSSDFPPPDP